MMVEGIIVIDLLDSVQASVQTMASVQTSSHGSVIQKLFLK